jgi:hypothetical protein
LRRLLSDLGADGYRKAPFINGDTAATAAPSSALLDIAAAIVR